MTLDEFVSLKIVEYQKNESDKNNIIKEIFNVARKQAKDNSACLTDEEVAKIVEEYEPNVAKAEPVAQPKEEPKPVVKELHKQKTKSWEMEALF